MRGLDPPVGIQAPSVVTGDHKFGEWWPRSRPHFGGSLDFGRVRPRSRPPPRRLRSSVTFVVTEDSNRVGGGPGRGPTADHRPPF
ncbi:hypothetical protein CDL15_Pgr006635 [Punica granatum]|uniref:Uncharacterized protein n=1 Tax=Punica granatum TaxID=22663 RepID=A0A218X5U8_PUNGR|nr:hypothetical protein CDL15_Pgr006635 [Punica granatum]PKI33411.1 hypothetical protein CRG98_046196 [Punica granatum]